MTFIFNNFPTNLFEENIYFTIVLALIDTVTTFLWDMLFSDFVANVKFKWKTNKQTKIMQ